MRLAIQQVDGMRFLATAGQHTVTVDAAPEDGGTGTALSAPQLFAAALGACVLEFVANSCRLNGVSFERLGLEIECEERTSPHRIGAAELTIHIEPEPPEDVKRRLVGVARHATLVNTLARPPAVSIHLSEE
jgi:uncharacterized OsmC-like protein